MTSEEKLQALTELKNLLPSCVRIEKAAKRVDQRDSKTQDMARTSACVIPRQNLIFSFLLVTTALIFRFMWFCDSKNFIFLYFATYKTTYFRVYSILVIFFILNFFYCQCLMCSNCAVNSFFVKMKIYKTKQLFNFEQAWNNNHLKTLKKLRCGCLLNFGPKCSKIFFLIAFNTIIF